MRPDSIPRIRLLLTDADGDPLGENFDSSEYLSSIPLYRVVAVNTEGEPQVNLGLGGSSSGSGTVNANDVGFDVWLIAGQSNTKTGEGIDTALDTPDSRVYQYAASGNYNNQIILASEPLQHTEIYTNNVGFPFTFGKWYVRTQPNNRTILLVPTAVGGTGFSNNRWNPGNDLHENAIAKTNAAIATFPKNKFKGILWHQGEADADSTTLSKAAYITALDACFNSFRSRITGAANCYIILGEMVRSWVGSNASRNSIQQAIQETPNRFSNCAVASSLSLNPQGDGIHFNAISQRIFGYRYFSAYIGMLVTTPPPNPNPTVPETPTNLSFTIQSSSVECIWQGLATSWKYQYKLSSDSNWNTEITVNVNIATITGLTPNTTYNFRVKAVNSRGESSYATSNFTTQNVVTVPNSLLRITFENSLIENTGTGTYTISLLPGDVQLISNDSIRGKVGYVGGSGGAIRVEMPLTSNHTKSLWFKQQNTFNPNLNFLSSASNPQHVLWSPGTDMKFTAGIGDSFILLQNPTQHLIDVWYHVVVTYDNTSRLMKMFVNGVNVSQATYPTNYPGSASPLFIGAYSPTEINNGVGRYDNVRIWDIALSDQQVLALYNSELI
jgi:hypothetical protein